LKNLPKKIHNAIEGAFSGGSSKDNLSSESASFKMNPSEYEQIGIKIGDKITLEIKISNNYNIGDITYQQQ
jgi:formylmethanofuran dehydrogenase subunit D